MKIGRTVFFIIFSLLITSELSAAINKVENNGFERELTAWSQFKSDWRLPDLVLERENRHSGAFSLRVPIEWYFSPIFTWYENAAYQDIPFSAGEPLYAGAYVKTKFHPLSLTQVYLEIEVYDNNRDTLITKTSQRIGGGCSWRLLEVRLDSTPLDTAGVRLKIGIKANEDDNLGVGGLVYFDDIKLTNENRSLKPQYSILNSGFENGVWDWSISWREIIIVDPALAFMITDDTVHSGNYALYTKVFPVHEDYTPIALQDLDIPKGSTELRASVYVKSDFINSDSKAKSGLKLVFFDANNNEIDVAKKWIAGQTDWVKLDIARSIPKNATKVCLTLYCDAPQDDEESLDGKAYFDDVSLAFYK